FRLSGSDGGCIVLGYASRPCNDLEKVRSGPEPTHYCCDPRRRCKLIVVRPGLELEFAIRPLFLSFLEVSQRALGRFIQITRVNPWLKSLDKPATELCRIERRAVRYRFEQNECPVAVVCLISWPLSPVIVIVAGTFKALDTFGKELFQLVEIVYPVAA